MRNLDRTSSVMINEGEVSYIGDDGKMNVTKYYTGLGGTHVKGNHFPVSVTSKPISELGVSEEPVTVEGPIVESVAEPYKH